MFTYRVRQLGLIALLVCCGSPVQASALTYAFSGKLNQPFDGSTQISGTFTYDTDLPLYPGIQPSPGLSYYSGVPSNPNEPVVSMTFTIGNTPSSTLGIVDSDEVIVSHNQSSDSFDISEHLIAAGNQNFYAELGMANNNFVQRAPFSSTEPPSSLNLADFSWGASMTIEYNTSAAPQFVDLAGTITSLVSVSTVPEPTSLIVFLGLGAVVSGFRWTNRCRQNL